MKDNVIYLKHIFDSIELIEKYNLELNKKRILNKQYLMDAIIRRFEIIGEATKNVSREFKIKHKQIPWRDMSDMRNFLIHEYFDVDEDELMKTIKNDLPGLKKKIKELI